MKGNKIFPKNKKREKHIIKHGKTKLINKYRLADAFGLALLLVW